MTLESISAAFLTASAPRSLKEGDQFKGKVVFGKEGKYLLKTPHGNIEITSEKPLAEGEEFTVKVIRDSNGLHLQLTPVHPEIDETAKPETTFSPTIHAQTMKDIQGLLSRVIKMNQDRIEVPAESVQKLDSLRNQLKALLEPSANQAYLKTGDNGWLKEFSKSLQQLLSQLHELVNRPKGSVPEKEKINNLVKNLESLVKNLENLQTAGKSSPALNTAHSLFGRIRITNPERHFSDKQPVVHGFLERSGEQPVLRTVSENIPLSLGSRGNPLPPGSWVALFSDVPAGKENGDLASAAVKSFLETPLTEWNLPNTALNREVATFLFSENGYITKADMLDMFTAVKVAEESAGKDRQALFHGAWNTIQFFRKSGLKISGNTLEPALKALLSNTSPGQELKNLYQLAGQLSEGNPDQKKLAQELITILRNLFIQIGPGREPQPDHIKNRLENSGMFFESKLEKMIQRDGSGKVIKQDIKAAMLAIISKTRQNVHVRGEILQEIRESAIRVVGHLEIRQVAPEAGSEHFVVPVMMEKEPVPFEIILKRKGPRGGKKKDTSHITISCTTSNLGSVRSEIQLIGNKLSIEIDMENKSAIPLFQDEKAELFSKFELMGISLENFKAGILSWATEKSTGPVITGLDIAPEEIDIII